MKNKIKTLFLISLAAGILILSDACSSLNKQHSAPPLSEEQVTSPKTSKVPEDIKSSDNSLSSSITLDYELGRDHYLFQVTSTPTSISVKSYLDKHLLKEGQVSSKKYLEYFNKVVLFISSPRGGSTKDLPCRGPFTVTLESNGSSKSSKGCRSNGEAGISRLIREGEFLLYSPN
jgi:hypothetical protein